jgi:hypothetical protein
VRRPRTAANPRPGQGDEAETLARASVVFWTWFGEELPRYAEALSREMIAVATGGTTAGAASERLTRLTQRYLESLAGLPGRMAAELHSERSTSSSPRERRRHGRVVD